MTNTIETLDWLIEYWPDLLEARLPMATRRPWQTPHLDAEARELIDATAALDRYFRNPLGVQESPAPIDVNVLQVVLDVLVAADDLAALLGPECMCPVLASPGPGQLDARPWLRYAAARLHELGEAWQTWTADKVHRMYEAVARALAMKYDGQTIKVICPWCLGRTAEAPIGGAYTWRVVTLPGEQIAIVCHGLCEPPQREVGTWWGGQPCWPLADWERLAKHVRATGHTSHVMVAFRLSMTAHRITAPTTEPDPEEVRQRLVEQIEESRAKGSGRA